MAPPSGSARPKRPRWLVVALVGALVIGAGCWTEGCERLAFYRGETDRQASALVDQVHDGPARAHVEALYRRYTELADARRKRAIPLAAATFVLGAALLALAARGLAGRSNARSALVQVVAAQALVVAATAFVLRDVRQAEYDFSIDVTLAREIDKMPADRHAAMVESAEPVRHYGLATWLVIRSVASALIVFALTRQRSREFFEAAAGQVSER